MNERTKQELLSLTVETIRSIKKDYKKGTGLTLRDITYKYSITFAAATHICKSVSYEGY